MQIKITEFGGGCLGICQGPMHVKLLICSCVGTHLRPTAHTVLPRICCWISQHAGISWIRSPPETGDKYLQSSQSIWDWLPSAGYLGWWHWKGTGSCACRISTPRWACVFIGARFKKIVRLVEKPDRSFPFHVWTKAKIKCTTPSIEELKLKEIYPGARSITMDFGNAFLQVILT